MKHEHWVWLFVVIFMASEILFALHTSNWDFLDEVTYIQASARTLYHQPCALEGLYPTVCNYEHPPLTKVLEAISLAIFGSVVPSSAVSNVVNGPELPGLSSSLLWFLSFRFFQILLGALSLPVLYVTALKISRNKTLALLSAAILLLEPLYLFFSRTAFLDVPMVFFALCAYAVYFSSFHLGRLSECWLVGILLGLSTLCKENGAIFFFPLVFYHYIFRGGGVIMKLKESAIILVSMAATFVMGLQAYDTLTPTPFPNFIDHIVYMVNFSNSISCRNLCASTPSPFSWFFFYTRSFWFDGFSSNLVLLWFVLAWIPVGMISLWMSRKKKLDPEDRLFIFAALLFGSTFTANCLIYLVRGTLVWYYLTMVPALAIGAASLIMRRQIPGWMKICLLVSLVLGSIWAYELGPSFLAYD